MHHEKKKRSPYAFVEDKIVISSIISFKSLAGAGILLVKVKPNLMKPLFSATLSSTLHPLPLLHNRNFAPKKGDQLCFLPHYRPSTIISIS